MDPRLYSLVDFILNQAEDRDVEVILQAVKRRYDDRNAPGAMGIKPAQMARETARKISGQMGFSEDMVRDMVKKMARETIAQNAPELSPSEIEELLEAWVPRSGGGESGPDRSGKEIPRDALVTMVKQFVSYSLQTMSATEQMQLEGELSGWPVKYWERFPAELRRLLGLYLKGVITEADFQAGFAEIIK
ncbi:MAG: hypothetical protein LBQ61_09375 [Spirochaetales bacterium]|jgi:hypothetical protein|nr:hypothetical protein [Spirochaetales bacterium]